MVLVFFRGPVGEVRELPPELAVSRAHFQLSLWLVMPVSKREAKKTHEDPFKSSRGSGSRSTQCSCEGLSSVPSSQPL